MVSGTMPSKNYLASDFNKRYAEILKEKSSKYDPFLRF